MRFIDFETIVRYAWLAYDATRNIKRITDISARVSTNNVFRIVFEDKTAIIAKVSYFGKYEHFVEDHTIINAVANNLPEPFDNFLARSLTKGNLLFVHRFKSDLIDAWVVFYRPIKSKNQPPRRLSEADIAKFAHQFALFHKACDSIRHTLPPSSKNLSTDIDALLERLNTEVGQFEYRLVEGVIRSHCAAFLKNSEALGMETFSKIPVFVDWNIGNFSIATNWKFYSRWDYDWFRISSRMLDFYFISRVVSDVGDRTVFSYNVDPLMEDRFVLFLKKYHEIYPLTELEIRSLKEVYRFFILNYVVKEGKYFFHELFATKLQREAFEQYLPSVENFNPDKLLKALKL